MRQIYMRLTWCVKNDSGIKHPLKSVCLKCLSILTLLLFTQEYKWVPARVELVIVFKQAPETLQ